FRRCRFGDRERVFREQIDERYRLTGFTATDLLHVRFDTAALRRQVTLERPGATTGLKCAQRLPEHRCRGGDQREGENDAGCQNGGGREARVAQYPYRADRDD